MKISLITPAAKRARTGNRATAVEYAKDGRAHRVEAEREIILSGGAINSPQALMLSGIGPADHLREHGIDVALDLPGVGRNLMDHATVATQFACTKSLPMHRVDRPLNKMMAGARWLLDRGGIAASNVWEAGGMIRGNDAVKQANLQYHYAPMGYDYDGTTIRLKQAFTLQIDQLRPASRGHIALKSADPSVMQELVEGIMKARDLVAQRAFDGLRGVELRPGPDVRTPAEIAEAVRQTAATDYHPCGTCSMGQGPQAVVDGQFRVHGIEGLRVVDASAMPTIISANLNATTQMMAARAADYILGNPQLAPFQARYAFMDETAAR